MAKTREEKKQLVEDNSEKFTRIQGAVFVNYRGLKVKEIEALRKQLRAEQIEYQVIKKTLLRLMIEKAQLTGIPVKELEGQLGFAWSYEDEILPAKLVYQFSRQHEALTLLGGILEKNFISQDKVLFLAQLPTHDQLLGQLVSVIAGPIRGMLNVLQGNLRNLLYVLKAIEEKNQ